MLNQSARRRKQIEAEIAEATLDAAAEANPMLQLGYGT